MAYTGNNPVLQDFYKKYFPEKIEQQQQKQFAESYRAPQKSLIGKLTGDMGTFLTSLPRIPGALARTIYESDIMQKAGYNVDKSFWSQAFKRTPFSLTDRLKILGTTIIPDVLPASTYEKMGIPYSPRRDMFRKLYLDSLIQNTGKWVYNPEAEGRKWLPSPKEETSRWKDYYQHPFLAPFEDIMNIALPLQVAGVSPIAKLATTRLGQAVGKTAPAQAFKAAKVQLAERSTFANIISEMKAKQFNRLKNIRTGRLKKLLEAVPEGQQPELRALLQRRAEPWNIGQALDDAWKATEKSMDIESKSLIARGRLAPARHTNAVWRELTTEFGQSIDDLEKLGIKEPVYFPATYEAYPSKPYFSLRKRTPGYLKEKKIIDVEKQIAMGREEPFISIPKHKAEYYVQKTTAEALSQIEKTLGKPWKSGDAFLPGYGEWKPGGYFDFFKTMQKPFGAKTALRPGVGVSRAVGKMQMPNYIIKSMNEMLLTTPEAYLTKFLKASFDKVTNTWKMSVLALSPRWIVNNFLGNTMLNLAGGVNPKAYFDAFKVWKNAKNMMKTQGVTFERAMRRQGITPGVWQSGIYQAEARVATPGTGGSWLVERKPITNAWKKIGYKIAEVPKAMYRVNSGVESFFRTAHYLDKIGKSGFNSKLALKSVNEFLFDYSAMTTFEKAFIRRIDPFWAWHKNITRLVATYPFKYPVRAGLVQKLQQMVEDDKDYRFVPEYMKSYQLLNNPFTGEPIQIGGENAYINMRGMNPFSDIFMGMGSLHPLLKMLVERSTGTELYKGKSFTSPYQSYGSNEKVVPSLGRHLMMQVPQLNLIEDLIRPYAKYSTGEPILDRETGDVKYPQNRILELLKMWGVNISPYNLEEMTQQGMEQAMREQKTRENFLQLLEQYKNK